MSSREERISENLGLVHSCARRFKGRGIEYDDLFQAGCVGLVKAVDHFEEERGLCFSTYAVPVILGEIRRLFRDGGTVKVGRTLNELSLKASRETANFTEREGRPPSVGELADILQVEPELAAQAICAGQQPLSLTADPEEGGGQVDVRVEGEEENIAELLSLKEAVRNLEARDRSIIYFRYIKSRTQTETASELGMTQVQVSRREKVILRNLREQLTG